MTYVDIAGNQQHLSDMTALHKAIETKENRLTELVVQINSLETKVRESELLSSKYFEDMKVAQQEAADTVLLFSQLLQEYNSFNKPKIGSIPDYEKETKIMNMSLALKAKSISKMSVITEESSDAKDAEGSNDTNEYKVMYTSIEYEALKDTLDQSQEEVVELNDKLEQLNEKLSISNQRIQLFEQLLSLQNKHGQKSSKNDFSALTVHASSPGLTLIEERELTDIVATIKSSHIRVNSYLVNMNLIILFYVKSCPVLPIFALISFIVCNLGRSFVEKQ